MRPCLYQKEIMYTFHSKNYILQLYIFRCAANKKCFFKYSSNSNDFEENFENI